MRLVIRTTNVRNPRLGSFRCGSGDHLLEKCTKPEKENKKRRKKVRLNKKGNHAYDNGKDNSEQKIYVYMARMSDYDECTSGNFGDSLQLTNWILGSGSTCHMTPEVSDSFQVFIRTG